MKVKNVTKEPRQLYVDGVLMVVEPGKTIEGRKLKFDEGSFKIETKKSKEETTKLNKEEQ